jgi:hypothetical protein
MACLSGLALLASSCSVVRTETQQTKSLVESLAVGKQSTDAGQQLTVLQTVVMREADQYTAMVAQAVDDLHAKVGTPEARIMAQQWKLQQATAACISASGENPVLNAIDMVVLTTVSRMVVQDYWVGEKFGAMAEPLLDTQRQLETNAWGVAHGVLTPEQRGQLRELILQWRAENPRERNVGAARFSDLVKFMKADAAAQPGKGLGSLFSLAAVNPLSGLDPAVREVEQTRQLAARAMYYLERAPRLWSWQAELLTYQLADQPETRQVLSDVDRVADSTRTFAKTAEGLPGLIREEREAAINQLLAGVANERSNILLTLNAQEAQLRELLPQVRQTLTAGSDMANSVNSAVKSLDAFVRYVSPPDTNSTPADTNSPPFNVLDYGTAAAQVGAMAKDLNLLLTSVTQSVPQVTRLSEQAGADLERVVHRAFWLGLLLIGVLLAGALLAALGYRILSDKLKRAGGPPSASSP